MKARRGMKSFIRSGAICLVIFQVAVLHLGTTNAARGATFTDSGVQFVPKHGIYVSRILAVLESRIEDQEVLERTKEKLFTLSDKQTRLIASLSDQVNQEGNTTAASIAFLLMTVLITLL